MTNRCVSRISTGLIAVALAVGIGCSGAVTDAPSDDTLPENTGAVSAAIVNVPADVQCVEIFTSDYNSPRTAVDVTPGQSLQIRIAPISTGYTSLWGRAYNRPCAANAARPGLPDAAYPFPLTDGGGGGGDAPTWEAEQTYVYVAAGRTTNARMRFHQPGALSVSVEFDNCDADGGFYTTCPGLDGGPGVIDASPTVDASPPDGGPAPPPDAGPRPWADAGHPR